MTLIIVISKQSFNIRGISGDVSIIPTTYPSLTITASSLLRQRLKILQIMLKGEVESFILVMMEITIEAGLIIG